MSAPVVSELLDDADHEADRSVTALKGVESLHEFVHVRTLRLGSAHVPPTDWGVAPSPDRVRLTMSKRTNKKKINARRKKANHGRKPNAGRNS